MKKWLIFLTSSLFANEFDFDIDSFEKKTFEDSGYFRSDLTLRENDSLINSELNYKFNFKEINSDISTFLKKEESIKFERDFIVNEFYANFGESTNLIIGKKALKWGKGYAYNPIAFIDREKDPLEPELYKEGYILTNLKYIKSYSNEIIKNSAFDLTIIPTDNNLNEDFSTKKSLNVAMKYYILFYDTDIDFIFANSDIKKYGIDISKNIFENLEFHLEYGVDKYSESYLFGLKYINEYDLSLTLEYYKKWDKNKILFAKLNQKEPFELIYSNIYLKYLKNDTKNRYRVQVGFNYDFKNGFNFDTYLQNSNIEDEIRVTLFYYF